MKDIWKITTIWTLICLIGLLICDFFLYQNNDNLISIGFLFALLPLYTAIIYILISYSEVDNEK